MRLMLLAALTMVAFAANSVLNRMAVGAGLIDPLGYALVRLASGAAALALLVLLRRLRRGGALWPGSQGRAAGVGGLLAYLLGFSLAYRSLDAGTGALILFGLVQITMFAGAIASGEAVPARRWAGATLAFAGLVLLLAPTAGPMVDLRAAGLMALAGVGWGVYSLAGRRAADPLAATAANFGLGLGLALGLLALWPGAWAGMSARASGVWLAILSGAVTSGLGYALWYAVVPRLGAVRSAVAQLTVPLIAAAGGLLLIGEAPGPVFLISAALVLGGVGWASLPARRRLDVAPRR